MSDGVHLEYILTNTTRLDFSGNLVAEERRLLRPPRPSTALLRWNGRILKGQGRSSLLAGNQL